MSKEYLQKMINYHTDEIEMLMELMNDGDDTVSELVLAHKHDMERYSKELLTTVGNSDAPSDHVQDLIQKRDNIANSEI